MKLSTGFIFLILLINMHGEVRFVSKTGSSQAPYTSWATAADSIQKALNICNPGDTVYVGSGVYKEQIVYGNGISLIGSGMDSCVIDTRLFATQTDWNTVTINTSGAISGFHIYTTRGWQAGNGIVAFGRREKMFIQNNKIENCYVGIALSWDNGLIKNNIIIGCSRGIQNLSFDDDVYPVIEGNIFYYNTFSIHIPFGTRTTIKKNVIYLNSGGTNGIFASNPDTMYIYNNICIAENADAGLSQSNKPAIMHNNLSFGNFDICAMLSGTGFSDSRNNLILSKTVGILNKSGSINEKVRYNNSFGGIKNYSGFTPDSTNLSVDPMIVSDDTAHLDFHLQMFSPMIDAGDPSILDVDGTRSDIGCYGGPYGESYTYQDLAPRPPRNLTSTINGTVLKINWAKNTEADFAYYRIYRDTIPSFIPDTTKQIAKTTDTSYTELFKPGRNYYYKISATDNQGNESPKSEEVKLITGVNDKPVIQTEDYTLFANYPNPFNPSTKICYRLRKAGNVSLKVYDIKGSLVKQILNKWQSAGYYEEEFTGERKQTNDYVERLASGVYILWMDVKNENNIPVYTTSRKMMMLK